MRGISQRLPSLDGLRAFAVLLVIFAHSGETQGAPSARIFTELRLTFSGFLGVQIFFVISGFIITRLLIKEKSKNGQISLKRFWARRFLRILPPLLLYLGVISLFKANGVLHVSSLSQWASLFFFRNHLPFESDFFNAHYWSLSLEEQFYLLWPVLIAYAGTLGLRRGAWMVMIGAFLFRLILFFMGQGEPRWLIVHADCLMAGALAAMWVQEKGFSSMKPLSNQARIFHFGVLLLCLLITRVCATRFSPYFSPFQPTLVSIFVAIWIVRLVSVRNGFAYSILNQKLVIWLGTISYSVYIWQQLFTAAPHSWLGNPPWFAHFPLSVFLSIFAGWLSFSLIEQPLQRLRHHWDSFIGYGSNVLVSESVQARKND